jgi:hypothetical protein
MTSRAMATAGDDDIGCGGNDYDDIDGNDKGPSNAACSEKTNTNNKINTHHKVHELGDGFNEGPDLFPVDLWVDGTARCTNDRTPRALLWVDLYKI